MISKSDLKKIDTKLMYETYDKWPELAESSYNSELQKIDLDKIGDFVFVGMGGSGAINELFSSLLTKSKIHVTVVNLLPSIKFYMRAQTTKARISSAHLSNNPVSRRKNRRANRHSNVNSLVSPSCTR